MRAVVVGSVLVMVAACSKAKEPPPGTIVEVRDRLTNEVIPLDAVPQALLDESARTSELQSRGFDGGTLTVHKAWNYRGPSTLAPDAGAKLVAIEMTIDVPKGNHLDLDDLDIIDAADRKNYGSDPQLQRVTVKSEPAGWEDPVFTESSPVRFIAVWAVPEKTTAVQLGYWGQTLTTGDLTLAASGPALPDSTERVVAHGTAGRTASGQTRHLLVVECWCARTASAPWSLGIVDSAPKPHHAVRAVEVDEATQPIAAGGARALYSKRRWVLEVWAEPIVRGLTDIGRRFPPPAARLSPSKALIAALDKAPIDELALEP
jgi:hypothetical protein